jgi:hypothetical protein
MFGGRIFGGGTSSSSSGTSGKAASSDTIFNTTQTRREGEAMMAWFLRRWAPLSEGLFDVVDDAQMGLFRRPVVRRDSLGKDILASPNSWPAPSIVDHNESVLDISAAANAGENEMEESIGDDLFQEGMGENDVQSKSPSRHNSYEFGPGTMLPRIRINGRSPVHSTPKASTRGKGRKGESLSPRRDEDAYDISNENDYGTSSSLFFTSLLSCILMSCIFSRSRSYLEGATAAFRRYLGYHRTSKSDRESDHSLVASL